MWSTEYPDEGFNIRDGVCGEVVGGCRSGLFLLLENGQKAFAHFGGLCPGTKVLCTVLKKANARWDVLVAIDSVLAEAEAA